MTKPLSIAVALQTQLLLTVNPSQNKEVEDAQLSPGNGF